MDCVVVPFGGLEPALLMLGLFWRAVAPLW
jgi:hypothetical protein